MGVCVQMCHLEPQPQFYPRVKRSWVNKPTSPDLDVRRPPPWAFTPPGAKPRRGLEGSFRQEIGDLNYTPGASRATQSQHCSYFNHGFCFTNPALKPHAVLSWMAAPGWFMVLSESVSLFSKIITEFPFFPPSE